MHSPISRGCALLREVRRVRRSSPAAVAPPAASAGAAALAVTVRRPAWKRPARGRRFTQGRRREWRTDDNNERYLAAAGRCLPRRQRHGRGRCDAGCGEAQGLRAVRRQRRPAGVLLRRRQGPFQGARRRHLPGAGRRAVRRCREGALHPAVRHRAVFGVAVRHGRSAVAQHLMDQLAGYRAGHPLHRRHLFRRPGLPGQSQARRVQRPRTEGRDGVHPVRHHQRAERGGLLPGPRHPLQGGARRQLREERPCPGGGAVRRAQLRPVAALRPAPEAGCRSSTWCCRK